MNKLEARNVNVFYGLNKVINNVSISIKPNSVTAFIGPSGCGKSTFLRLFNRMNDYIDTFKMEGRIEIDGKNIYDKHVRVEELRKKIGMVFQKPNPFPKTIYENIVYGLRIQGIKDKKILDEVVEKSLKQAALWEEVKDKLKNSALALSGGQQQRLCIARTLAVEPTVILMDEPSSEGVKHFISSPMKKQIILLENLRFDPGETENKIELAQIWASYADIYINDAFGASHRAHASIHALPELMQKKGIGFLIEKEIIMLEKLMGQPAKPYLAVLGGSKVSDKIPVIEKLMDVVDGFVIGGAMAYTFLKAKGISVGKSLVEADRVKYAKEIMERIEARGKQTFGNVSEHGTASSDVELGAGYRT